MIARLLPETAPEPFLVRPRRNLLGAPIVREGIVALAGGDAEASLHVFDLAAEDWAFEKNFPLIPPRAASAPVFADNGRIAVAFYDPAAGVRVRRFKSDGTSNAAIASPDSLEVPRFVERVRLVSSAARSAIVELRLPDRAWETRAVGKNRPWRREARCIGVWGSTVVLSTRSGASLYGFDVEGGDSRWHLAVFPDAARTPEKPVLAARGADRILTAARSLDEANPGSEIVCVDPSNGAHAWSAVVRGVACSLLAPGHVVLVGTREADGTRAVHRFTPDGAHAGVSRYAADAPDPANDPHLIAADHTRLAVRLGREIVCEPIADPRAELWRLPVAPGSDAVATDGVLVVRDAEGLRFFRG